MKVTKALTIGLVFLVVSGTYMYAEGSQGSMTDNRVDNIIMTVRGPISASELGMVLSHEHVVGSFTKKAEIGKYDRDSVVAAMLPLLRAIKERGFAGLVETTPVDLSRDVVALLRLARATDLHIVTNTGNYGGFGDGLLLPYGFTESADQLAARWVKEFEEGIEDTGIRPGFIKIAVDPGPLSEIDRKLAQAAARAHLQTGLTINSHTAEAVAALDLISTLRSEGVDPSALIVTHSDEIADQEIHFQIAEAGAWVSYDHVGRPNHTIEEHVGLIKAMLDKGYGHRMLISHDSVWYDVSDPGGWMEFGGTRMHPALGGAPWATTISDELVPALESAGVSKADIRMLFVDNPANALTIRIRNL